MSSNKTPDTLRKNRRKSNHHHQKDKTSITTSKKKTKSKRKRNSQIVTSSEKAAQLEALKQEFNEYRAKLLEEWMWKKPRGFDKLKWQRRFRPPSRKAWTNKKRMDRVAADLAYEKATNMFPPSERYVSMEHRVDPDRARFLDMNKIAVELIDHTFLRGLYLTRCIVGDKGLKILCNALKKTKTPLQILDLRSNSITDSGAKRIFAVLKEGHLPKLKSLGLGYNQLTSKAAKIFSELLLLGSTNTNETKTNTITRNETQERLIETTDESDIEEDQCDLFESKMNETVIKKKRDRNKGTTKTHKQKEQKEQKKLPENTICLKLTSIDLYHNDGATPLRRRISMFKGSHGIGRKGIMSIAQALKFTNVPLTDLNLWSINMGPQGVKLLGEALEITSAPIRRLGLSKNQLSNKGVIALANSLKRRALNSGGSFLKRRLPLEYLDLSVNSIGDDGMIEISEAFSVMAGDVEDYDKDKDNNQQDKYESKMNDSDTNNVMHSNYKSKTKRGKARMPLKRVNLSCNQIGDDGLIRFALILRQFSSYHPLRNLDLSDNKITDVGIIELCWALDRSKTKRFKHLNLNNNVGIRDTGGLAIANTLITTRVPITTLKLNNVGLTNISASALADSLRKSKAPLESLPIRDNNITSHLKGFVKNWVIFRESQVVTDSDGSEDGVVDDRSIRSVEAIEICRKEEEVKRKQVEEEEEESDDEDYHKVEFN